MIVEKTEQPKKQDTPLLEGMEDDDFEEFDTFGNLNSHFKGRESGAQECPGRRLLAAGLGRRRREHRLRSETQERAREGKRPVI